MVFNILESRPNQFQEKNTLWYCFTINQVGLAFNIACELGPKVSMALTYQTK
jgi:hypothetical protein